MTNNSNESQLIERKGKEKISEEASANKEIIDSLKDAEQVRSTWQTVKYYFNRFRYYHFIVADTIDKYASAACLWIINLYFKLFMGIGPEPSSVLTEEE